MTITDPRIDELERARRDFHADLVAAGLLIPTSEPGVLGKSGVFEAVLGGLDALLTEMAAPLASTVMRFPPVLARADFERTSYIESFPDLVGVVSSFEGSDREHRALLAAREAGESYEEHLHPAAWCSPMRSATPSTAACRESCPPTARRSTSSGGASATSRASTRCACRRSGCANSCDSEPRRMRRRTATSGWASRSTPSPPWICRSARSRRTTRSSVAREAPHRDAAARQREGRDRRADLWRPHRGTAIASANCQRESLTSKFDIRTSDGELAHGACLAFGMERSTLALFRTHGLDLADWPAGVRAGWGCERRDPTRHWFGDADEPILGFVSVPDDATARAGVVICAPLGHEHYLSYRGLRLLGDDLAERGFATVRFDYAGEGDSGGVAPRANAPELWLSSIEHAVRLLRDAGVSSIALVGLTSGALLAALAAPASRTSTRSCCGTPTSRVAASCGASARSSSSRSAPTRPSATRCPSWRSTSTPMRRPGSRASRSTPRP